MVPRLAVIVSCLAVLEVSAEAQSSASSGVTYFIPALRSGSASELGVVLVNPTPAAQTVTLTARGYDGRVISGTGIRNPVELSIPAQGQVAQYASAIFGMGIADGGGWVELTSPSKAIKGFFLLSDARPQTMDGGELVETAAPRLVFMQVDNETTLHIVNTGTSQLLWARLLLYNNDGGLAGDRFIPLVEAQGGWSGRVGDLIPGLQAVEGYAIVLGNGTPFGGGSESLAGMASYGRTGDGAIVMARSDTERMRTGYAAHLAVGGGYTSRLKLVNTEFVEQRMKLTLGGRAANAADLIIERTLPARGRLDESLDRLFGLSGDALTTGYLRLDTLTNTPGVYGMVEIASGQARTAVPFSGEGRTEFVFPQVAEVGGYYTGTALLDSESVPATVSMELYRATGTLAGSKVFTLGAGQRTANLVREMFPEARDQLNGYVRVLATPAIHGLQIIGYDGAAPALANVPVPGARLDFRATGAVVSATGGVVMAEGERATLIVPAGALKVDARIELRWIDPATLPAPPAGQIVLGAVEVLAPKLELPARLTFVLQEPAAPGGRFPLMKMNPATLQYEASGFFAAVDDTGHLASADVTQFSFLALLGPPQLQTLTLDPPRGSSGVLVRVQGTDLDAVTRVAFTGYGQEFVPGEIVSRTRTEIVVRVPDGAVTGRLIATSQRNVWSLPFEIVSMSLNPLPVLSGTQPGYILSGESISSLTLMGMHFARGATVTLNGTRLPAAWINSTILVASVPASMSLGAGYKPVRVANPGPGGGNSAEVRFEVRYRRPLITSIGPRALDPGTIRTLTIRGKNFTPETQVTLIGGGLRSARFIDAETITAEIVVPEAGSIRVTAPAPAEMPNSAEMALDVVQPPPDSCGPTGAPPVISSFTASPSILTAAQPSTLSWASSNAAACSISGGVGSVPCSGSTTVTPGVNTTYTLTATGSGGTATATASVTAGAAGRFVYVANIGSGNVSMYTINLMTGQLIPIGAGSIAAGMGPFSVVADPAGKFAYVTNVGSSDVSMYTINSATGALAPIGAGTIAAGTGPQSVTVDPTGKFAYTANVGSNNLSMYTINSTTGALTSIGTIGAGNGPLSVAADPRGKFVYAANVASNSVSMYTINAVTGALTSIGTIGTGIGPQSVTVDPTGKFAYTANAGSNDVSMYTINAMTGALAPIGAGTVAGGMSPQSVTVDPTGKFAYVANVVSNDVSMYTINAMTGALAPIAGAIAAGMGPFSVAA